MNTLRSLGLILLIAGAALAIYTTRARMQTPPRECCRTDAPAAPHSAVTAAPAPSPSPPAAAPAEQQLSLAERLNRELASLGLPPEVRIVTTQAQGDRLTVTFNAALRRSLGPAEVSALDEIIEGLSRRVLPLGYQHLDVRVRLADDAERAVSVDELFGTPASSKPRPEPIDDGVRK